MDTEARAAAAKELSLRQYLDARGVSDLMRRFVVAVGEQRPDDVLGFMSSWALQQRDAQAKRSRVESPPPPNSEADEPARLVFESWTRNLNGMHGKIVRTWFELLFTQHASLRLKFFRDTELETDIFPPVTEALDSLIHGRLTPEDLRGLGKLYSAGRSVEMKHFHYLLTSLLSSISMCLGGQGSFSSVADPWRVILSAAMDELAVGAGVKKAPKDDEAASERSTVLASSFAGEVAFSVRGVVGASWQSLDKAAVVDKFFSILLSAHPLMKQRVFADVDMKAVKNGLLELAGRRVLGALPDEELGAMAHALISNHPKFTKRYLHYGLSAWLFAIKQTFVEKGGFDEYKRCHQQWLSWAGNIVAVVHKATVTKLLAAEFDPSDMLTMTTAGNSMEISSLPSEASVGGLDAIPSELVKRSWNAVFDKPSLVKCFFDTLFTQHPSVRMTLFRDVDVDGILAPALLPLLDDALKGNLGSAALQRLGSEYGSGRRPETRHFHYFLTAMLTAVGRTLGSQFAQVAEPWRIVLTYVLGELQTGSSALATPLTGGELPTLAERDVKKDTDSPPSDDEEDVRVNGPPLEVVKAQWGACSDAARKKIVTQFFHVLFIQHNSLKLRLFSDVEISAVETAMLPLLTQAINGDLDEAQLGALGKKFGAPRKPEPRHFHYFLTAMLGAVQATLGAAAFVPTAEAWRVTLTTLCEEIQKGATMV